MTGIIEVKDQRAGWPLDYDVLHGLASVDAWGQRKVRGVGFGVIPARSLTGLTLTMLATCFRRGIVNLRRRRVVGPTPEQESAAGRLRVPPPEVSAPRRASSLQSVSQPHQVVEHDGQLISHHGGVGTVDPAHIDQSG